MKTICYIIAFLAGVAVALTLSGCSFKIDADGAKSFNLDGEGAAKALLVISQKSGPITPEEIRARFPAK